MMSNKTTQLEQIMDILRPRLSFEEVLNTKEIAQKIIDLLNLWKPIETAPRDGTPVDLWYVKGDVNFAVDCVWWTDDDCWSNVTDDRHYSHWRPIIGPNGEQLSPIKDED